MAFAIAPTDLRNLPDHIGKVVMIQIFDKDPARNPESDELPLISESLQKYCGTLKSFGTGKNFITISLDSMPLIYVSKESQHFEVFSVRFV